ncbi:MAG TPA: MucR family transcriptional regulator [Magnetospirillaceae bacterium]|jgi:predicted transcriptional regulator
MPNEKPKSLLEMTARITAAHLSNNGLPLAEIPALINDIFRSLSDTDAGRPPGKDPTPAVAIKRSITADHIVCLEEGLKFKSLKRHLRTAHSLAPDEYRRKWALAADYPMTAPNYARHRSSLAKKIGLGKAARRKKK